MENSIAKYIEWYKNERKKFVSNVYLDKSKWHLPYANLDDKKIIEELDFSAKAIAKLKNINFTDNKKILSNAILAISNRIEYTSDQSDFYTTLAALIGFTTTIVSIGQSLELKIIIGFFGFCGFIYSIKKRSDLRQEVAHQKEIVNIFNQFKNDYTKD